MPLWISHGRDRTVMARVCRQPSLLEALVPATPHARQEFSVVLTRTEGTLAEHEGNAKRHRQLKQPVSLLLPSARQARLCTVVEEDQVDVTELEVRLREQDARRRDCQHLTPPPPLKPDSDNAETVFEEANKTVFKPTSEWRQVLLYRPSRQAWRGRWTCGQA